jgi:gamma-glutamyltranspeptidase / glutathione hydrolase
MKKLLVGILYILIGITPFSVFANPLISKAQFKNGMVVSSQHLATQVGIDILKKGGNAIDAAVAVGYALAVVHPCCGNIGGGGFMMIHQANGKNIVLNFREKAPAALKPKDLVKQNSPYINVGIPGTVMGLNTALKVYGSMSLKEVMQPSIQLAEKGFPLHSKGTVMWFDAIGAEEKFRKQANVAKIFLRDGKLLQAGDILVQKNLANTLKLISQKGEKAFYHGAIADSLVKASQENGGLISKTDLMNYSVTFEKPLVCEYEGYPVLTTPPPSGGGFTLCELLKVAEGLPNYAYDSIDRLRTNLEIMRYVYQDKARYSGDSDFSEVPVSKLLSQKHIQTLQAKVEGALKQKKVKKEKVDPDFEKPYGSTTSYIVADGKGNVVAVTYTINNPFGAKVMAGNTGFFLNDELKDFSYGKSAQRYKKEWGTHPNFPAAYKRPASSITQAMLFSKNKNQLLLALATPGGDTIPAQMFNTIETFIDNGANAKALPKAVNFPRYFYRWMEDKVYLEPGLRSKQKEFEAMAYRISKGSGCSESGSLKFCGGMTGVYIDAKAQFFLGIVDRRRPAGLAGAVDSDI